MDKPSRVAQSGFTLIELVIVLMIIGMLSTLAISAFQGDRSKATVLLAKMSQMGDAMVRLAQDAPCYPVKTGALIDKSLVADPAGSFCNKRLDKNWRGPYIKGMTIDQATGHVLVPEAGEGVFVSIGREGGPGATGINGQQNIRQWVLKAENVPADIADNMADICNSGQGKEVGFQKGQRIGGRCALEGSGDSKTVYYIFDERGL